MNIVEIAQVNEIPQGTMKSYSAGGKQILISNIEGKFYAIGSTCTHAGGDLSKGKLEGNIITCPNHHAKFDVTTGQCVSGPKIGFFKGKAKDETAIEVKVEENKIKIVMP